MSDETTLTIKEAQQKIEESKAIVNEKLKLLNEKLSKIDIPQPLTPPDFSVITADLENVINRLNGISKLNLCDFDVINELQNAINEALGKINGLIDALKKQLEALNPFLALLEGPSSLADVIKWIKKFITAFVGPQVNAYYITLKQYAELIKTYTKLLKAINNAANNLKNLKCEAALNFKMPSIPSIPSIPE